MSIATPWQISVTDPGLNEAGVRALAQRTAREDGVAALSEHSLLHLGSPDSRHVHAYADSELIGYAQVWADQSAELLVAPDARCRGLGSALLEEAHSLGAQRGWAHGDLAGAAGLAQAYGWARVRELHRMTRPLTADDTRAPEVPEGFTVRRFVPGQDEDTWLRTNAAAFASHPEQGSLTRADLDQRMAQDWFAASDFIVLTHRDAPEDIAAFHWLKVEPGSEVQEGETYVVGIDPAYQGRGLAGPLTQLGIAHLASRGLREVELYVDGDNERAVRTYTHAGFEIAATDVVYAAPA